MNRLYINKDWSSLKKLIAINAAGGGEIVEHTITGNPATFNTNVIAPMELLIPFTPVQDLHGYENPWPAGGGKNLLENTGISQTVNGVTYTVNSDGSVTANGTATASGSFSIHPRSAFLSAGSYKLNGNADFSAGVVLQVYSYTQSINIARCTSNNDADFSIQENDEITVVLYVFSGQTLTNFKFYPMIRLASVTDDTFAPYSNICPISGWTGANVTVSPTSSQDDPDKEVYPITFPQLAGTVYGGTLTVNKDGSGELVVDRANITSYNGETLPSTWISDRDVYAQGTTPTTGAQVVYELATPVTYQLTDLEILETLKGVNNVWSDTNGLNTIKYMKKG